MERSQSPTPIATQGKQDLPQAPAKPSLSRQMTVEQFQNLKQARFAGCKLELRNLVIHKREQHASGKQLLKCRY